MSLSLLAATKISELSMSEREIARFFYTDSTMYPAVKAVNG
jgi:hypothetical protein